MEELAWSLTVRNQTAVEAADEGNLWTGALNDLSVKPVHILIRRRMRYEFRHAEMRAYLAARRLIRRSPTVPHLEEQIKQVGELFEKSRAEFWRFVAAMVPSPEHLQAFWRFSNEEPEKLKSLSTAVREDAENVLLRWSLNRSAEGMLDDLRLQV